LGLGAGSSTLESKDPGPEVPALVYPRGDKFNATSLAHGVLEYWSVGVLINNLEQRWWGVQKILVLEKTNAF